MRLLCSIFAMTVAGAVAAFGSGEVPPEARQSSRRTGLPTRLVQVPERGFLFPHGMTKRDGSGDPSYTCVAEDAEPIRFVDAAGRVQTPLSQPDRKATVLFFVLADCPISNAYAPEIGRICADCEKRKVATFVVHADPDVTMDQVRTHAKAYGFACPLLRDPAHVLVKKTGVTTAPEVAVLTPDGKVAYRGRIDDWYVGLGKRRAAPTRRDLRDALDAILQGHPVPTPTTTAIGCPLPDPKE
jgi:AhpC/TSA family